MVSLFKKMLVAGLVFCSVSSVVCGSSQPTKIVLGESKRTPLTLEGRRSSYSFNGFQLIVSGALAGLFAGVLGSVSQDKLGTGLVAAIGSMLCATGAYDMFNASNKAQRDHARTTLAQARFNAPSAPPLSE